MASVHTIHKKEALNIENLNKSLPVELMCLTLKIEKNVLEKESKETFDLEPFEVGTKRPWDMRYERPDTHSSVGSE